MIFVKITREQIALGANLRSDIIIYSVIDSYGVSSLLLGPLMHHISYTVFNDSFV